MDCLREEPTVALRSDWAASLQQEQDRHWPAFSLCVSWLSRRSRTSSWLYFSTTVTQTLQGCALTDAGWQLSCKVSRLWGFTVCNISSVNPPIQCSEPNQSRRISVHPLHYPWGCTKEMTLHCGWIIASFVFTKSQKSFFPVYTVPTGAGLQCNGVDLPGSECPFQMCVFEDIVLILHYM